MWADCRATCNIRAWLCLAFVLTSLSGPPVCTCRAHPTPSTPLTAPSPLAEVPAKRSCGCCAHSRPHVRAGAHDEARAPSPAGPAPSCPVHGDVSLLTAMAVPVLMPDGSGNLDPGVWLALPSIYSPDRGAPSALVARALGSDPSGALLLRVLLRC